MQVPPLKLSFSDGDIDDIALEIKQVLKTGWLTLGQKTKRFEEECAKMSQRRFAVAVNSGTTALEILLRAYDVKGKTVIAPANTNYATVAAIIFAGGIPKLVDGSLCFSLEDLKNVVDKNSVGIIIVHIGGYITKEIEDIVHFCKKNNLFLLEDAAHAHGASLSGKVAGKFGDAAAFSFFPTKVITSGEGGVIVTDNEDVRRKAFILRDQGKDLETKQYIMQGNSWRMSELHAVTGFHQIKHLKTYTKRRNEVIKYYDAHFERLDGVEMYKPEKGVIVSGYKHIIGFSSTQRCNKIKLILENKYKIYLSGSVYDVPIHKLPVFQNLFAKQKFPKAEKFCTTHLCLPIWSTITDKEVKYVIKSFKEAVKE